MEPLSVSSLLSLDEKLFLAINHAPHTPIANIIALTLSGIGQWGLVWILIAAVLFIREEKRDRWFFLPSVVTLALSASLSDLVLKFFIARPRPSEIIGAIILTNPGNSSFPSTHATLAFAMAYVLSHVEPALTKWFYVLAVCISLSRIYLGVHYPLDIVGGMILGTAIGWVSVKVERLFYRNTPDVQN